MLHSKQWHYSLHRDFQNCYSTRRSPTGFFSSNSTRVPIHHPHLHIHSTTQRILHPESNSTCRRQRALWVLLLHTEGKETFIPERNSTHRRQGDLLDIHPCVTRTFRHSSLSRQFYKFYNVPVFPGNPTHYSILQLECIFYNFYSPIGFHRKLHWAPVERYKHYNTFILQRKRDVAISVRIDIFSRIEFNPSFVLSSDNTNWQEWHSIVSSAVWWVKCQ